MELIAFVRKSIDGTLKHLEIYLYEIIQYILLLSGYHVLTEAEINANNTAFQWYHKMPDVLAENELIVATKTMEFQEALRGIVTLKNIHSYRLFHFNGDTEISVLLTIAQNDL